jgi:hypothetical protein
MTKPEAIGAARVGFRHSDLVIISAFGFGFRHFCLMNLDFPYQFDTRGRTAQIDYDAHIRDLIEQVLFTAPGERVNRPDFGSGLLRLVFAPNSDQLAATTQYLVQGSLQQYLGDLIQVDAVEVENEDSTLRVTVRYLVRQTQTLRTAEFTKGVPSA